jgi:hypothetical protein
MSCAPQQTATSSLPGIVRAIASVVMVVGEIHERRRQPVAET